MRPSSLASTVCLLAPAAGLAAPPTGYLDVASSAQVGGWARDPDHPDPIAVHVYIDGEIAHGLVADGFRPDAAGGGQHVVLDPVRGSSGGHDDVIEERLRGSDAEAARVLIEAHGKA